MYLEIKCPLLNDVALILNEYLIVFIVTTISLFSVKVPWFSHCCILRMDLRMITKWKILMIKFKESRKKRQDWSNKSLCGPITSSTETFLNTLKQMGEKEWNNVKMYHTPTCTCSMLHRNSYTGSWPNSGGLGTLQSHQF